MPRNPNIDEPQPMPRFLKCSVCGFRRFIVPAEESLLLGGVMVDQSFPQICEECESSL